MPRYSLQSEDGRFASLRLDLRQGPIPQLLASPALRYTWTDEEDAKEGFTAEQRRAAWAEKLSTPLKIVRT